MILTDEDRKAVFDSLPNALEGFLKTWGWLHFAKGIEQAVLDKLAARVELPEPAMKTHGAIDPTEKHWFTADQYRLGVAAARIKALEEAAAQIRKARLAELDNMEGADHDEFLAAQYAVVVLDELLKGLQP